MGHRERVVGRDRVAGLVEVLEQGEVDHPQEVEPALVHRRTAELEPQQTQDVAGHPAPVGHQEQDVPGLGLEPVGDAGELLGREELRNG